MTSTKEKQNKTHKYCIGSNLYFHVFHPIPPVRTYNLDSFQLKFQAVYFLTLKVQFNFKVMALPLKREIHTYFRGWMFLTVKLCDKPPTLKIRLQQVNICLYLLILHWQRKYMTWMIFTQWTIKTLCQLERQQVQKGGKGHFRCDYVPTFMFPSSKSLGASIVIPSGSKSTNHN